MTVSSHLSIIESHQNISIDAAKVNFCLLLLHPLKSHKLHKLFWTPLENWITLAKKSKQTESESNMI